MSTLTTVTNMVAECQTRVPIGLSTAFWEKKLNEGYRWISQKGNYVWDLKQSYVTVNATQTWFALPSDCDTGKPMYLAGPYGNVTPPDVTMNSSIPYQPWDESLNQQYAEVVSPTGLFSCWTFAPLAPFGTGAYNYQATLYPASAKPTVATGAFTFNFIYHTDVSATSFTGSNFFPTPNSFDNLLIELAEAEARRIYGLAGWDIIQKRAESAIVSLLDSYRSTKNILAGIVDQQKQTAEMKAATQERA